MINNKIRSFTDLKTWQEGEKLVVMIYKTMKKFPKSELFGLISQMRRCAVSITSNIAEGFSRNSSKDKLQFYFISRGSVTELQSQLYVSKDIGYLEERDFQDLFSQTVLVNKLVNGLIKSLQKKEKLAA